MIQILVVDDEVLISDLVHDALEVGGYSAVQVASGEEAIAALNDGEQAFAGLITDINIGDGLPGWDVARAARERNPEIPVVYMTGASADEWAVQGVPNSVLIEKPFAAAQIITAISQLINEAATRHGSVNSPD